MSNFRLICSDVLDGLRSLPDESVQCCITSPPYYGLRDYNTPPQIWGGDQNCNHDWQDATWRSPRWGTHDDDLPGQKQRTNTGSLGHRGSVKEQDVCLICNAWRGSLGHEPSPELFVQHLVKVFCEVRRVLRDDGTVWLNLGDSYASMLRSGRKESPGVGAKQEITTRIKTGVKWRAGDGSKFQWRIPSFDTEIKPKDLIGIPWRVAFALQADGWYLRSDIIWSKPNPMPESVTDRPTKAHEYIFLLAKSERYYYDREAIFEDFVSAHPSGNNFIRDARLSFHNSDGTARGKDKQWLPPSYKGSSFDRGKTKTAREHLAPVGGGPRNEQSGRNKRSVWTVTTQPFPDAHFAVFPEALVLPCVLAGSREGETVLDPFSGSGRTGVVALKNDRNYIGIELNPAYVEMSRRQLNRVPLRLPFARLTEEATA